MSTYDVVIIGAGPAGLAVAYPLQEQGKRVAIIESDLWGGTCPNRGCDPKKMLMRGVEVKEAATAMLDSGIVGQVTIDWPELMAHKRGYTEPVPTSTKQGLKEANIDTYSGAAAFVDPHTLMIGDQQITGEEIVIATGQRPAVLDIPGQEHLSSSTDFLDLDQLPQEIVFIGAGYITFELAVIAQAAGAQVHIIHHNQQPLKGFDQELVTALVAELSTQGIAFHLDTSPKALKKEADYYVLETDKGNFRAGMVIGATGRIPNVDTLQLETAHVEFDQHGVLVDTYLRTNQPHIYAIGDVLSKQLPKLTPVASFEAQHVVKVLAGKQEPIQYPLIPTLVFGHLKLARIGVSEKTIQKNTDQYSSEVIDLSKWYTYQRINDKQAKMTVVYDQAHKIAALTILSTLADELINTLVFVLGLDLTKDDLSRMIFAYPTPVSDLSSMI